MCTPLTWPNEATPRPTMSAPCQRRSRYTNFVRRILDHGVRRRHRVAGASNAANASSTQRRLVDQFATSPSTIASPVRSDLADRRVERQLHLVDGHAVGRHRDRLLDARAPVRVGLAEHAGDEVDVDLRKVRATRANAYDLPISGERCARPLISRMRSSKFSTPRLSRVTPISRMAASFASVSVPGSHSKVISSACRHGAAPRPCATTRLCSCLRREERRRAAAEVDEVQRPAGDRPLRAVQLPLARQRVEIALHLRGVLVGVDAEIAEVAPLPAERDVQIQPERHVGRRRRQRRPRIGIDGFRRPDGKGRVVGDEVAADLCGVVGGGGRHAAVSPVGQAFSFHFT